MWLCIWGLNNLYRSMWAWCLVKSNVLSLVHSPVTWQCLTLSLQLMVSVEVSPVSPGTTLPFRNSVFWSRAFCAFQATPFAELSVLYRAAACQQPAVATSSGELWLLLLTLLRDDYQEYCCRQQLLGACLPQASFSSPLSITGISVLISHWSQQLKDSRSDFIWDVNSRTICLPR